MSRSRLLLVACCGLLQSGCMLVTSSYKELEPQLVVWNKEREYGRALDALSQIEPTDPNYSKAAENRRHIESLASNYEQQVRKEVQQLLRKGDWKAVLDHYDQALEKLPKSIVLKDGLAKLHQQQRRELEELELERLVQHGQWLRSTLPVYQNIARVDARGADAQERLRRMEQQAEEVAYELSLVGNKALADNDLDTAERTLTLAVQLDKVPVIEGSLQKLRSQQQQQEKKQHAQRQRELAKVKQAQRAQAKLVTDIDRRYKKAIEKQNFQEARKQLDQLLEVMPNHPEAEKRQRELKIAIDKSVARLFDSGVSAYSRGQFEVAAKRWRSLLELDPEHQQAKENLERAEKVLEKIEALKKKQGS